MAAVLVAGASGCYLFSSSSDSPTTPPIVAAPTAGQVFDRCLVGARTNLPALASDNGSGAQTGTAGETFNVEATGHIDWRVNGGESNEVKGLAVDRDPKTPVVFGATLVPGMNHLELGRCDAVDFCGWTAVDVTVQQQSGSPDCSYAGTGQPMFEKFGGATHLTLLSDGRALVSVMPLSTAAMNGGTASPGIMALKADGTLDKTWGTNGFAAVPAGQGTPVVMPAPDGSFLVVFASTYTGAINLSRFQANGAVDTSFGTGGAMAVSTPAPGGATVLAVVAGASGKVLVAGGAVMDAMKFSTETPYVMELGFDGTPGTFTLLGSPAPYQQVMAAAVDPMGNAAVMFEDHLVKGSLSAGLDATFGTAGSAPTPNAGFTGVSDHTWNAVAFSSTGIVAAQHLHQTPSDVTVRFYDAAGTSSDVRVPFQSDIKGGDPATLLAVAPDDSVYLASMMVHPADPVHAWSKDQTGEDLAVARLRNKAFDTSFGAAGFSRVNSAMAWARAATDAVSNAPASLLVDAGGHPWLAGGSVSFFTDANNDLYDNRAGAAIVIKLLP